MRIRTMLVCLLMILALTACRQEPVSPETSVPVTTQPATEGTTAPTETAPEEIELAPVNTLSFRKTDKRPSIGIIDHRTVAFFSTEYDSGNYTDPFTRIQVLDLYTDTILAETRQAGSLLPLECQNGSGLMAFRVDGEQELQLVDKNLQEQLRIKVDSFDGVLDRENRNYYYLWGNVLYCLDILTGQAAPADIDLELPLYQLQGYDVEENVALFSAYTDPFTTYTALAAVDLDNGSLLALVNEADGCCLAEDGFWAETAVEESMSRDVRYGDWGCETIQSLPQFLTNDRQVSTWQISGTDYIWQLRFDPEKMDKLLSSDLYRMGETLQVCPMLDAMDGTQANQILALPDGNLLAMEYSRRGYTPHLIVPEQLEFSDAVTPEILETDCLDEAVLDKYAQELEKLILGEEFAEVRHRADEIGEKYGVTVMMSGQCATATEFSEMEITTTDKANLADEVGAIAAALEELNDVLALYPEDFFRQFRNNGGQRGLLVLLVEDFKDNLNVIGLSYGMGQWYPIAVDITCGEVASTYCHEIWHATENKINDVNSDLLANKVWDQYNPHGYVYSYDSTPAYIKDTQYTFFYGNPNEDVYFVDPYGKTKPQEDRARLMEYVMTEQRTAYEMLKEPALRGKFQLMADAIRAVFDTENWTDVHWERFF